MFWKIHKFQFQKLNDFMVIGIGVLPRISFVSVLEHLTERVNLKIFSYFLLLK
jgi:hypothetical protein